MHCALHWTVTIVHHRHPFLSDKQLGGWKNTTEFHKSSYRRTDIRRSNTLEAETMLILWKSVCNWQQFKVSSFKVCNFVPFRYSSSSSFVITSFVCSGLSVGLGVISAANFDHHRLSASRFKLTVRTTLLRKVLWSGFYGKYFYTMVVPSIQWLYHIII